MSKKSPHAATPALKVVEDAGIEHHVYTFESGTDHFGDHAAAALDVEPERVLKTLVIDLTAGKGPRRISGVRYPYYPPPELEKAAVAHNVSKAAMADPHDATKSSGYIPGGISPLGQKNPLPTIIEETAILFDTVFISGGRRGLDIELNAEDLAQLCDASFADLLAE
ncbi:aminoacyl-tRNA deacylase [Corynebacterium kefirresidentii]|uniref:aminoacyl-tRNA deacylase n=1 Tax=Corynebacterium sp. MSK185 TaxID=3377092 RepID=UPI00254BE1E3|nr:aminoacyl-tRNA deacylase [Corynebacterium kefirresidentii]MDK8586716.1 aminoacyl-tRNA deacylase [Corynebacterium kefirresidentii]